MHTPHKSPGHRPFTMRHITCSLCILLSAASFARAQEKQQLPAPGETLKVTTAVVNVYAVVKQKNGRLIPDLNKDDFLLEEDKQPQVIRYFARETDTPLTMGILVDTSPSQGRVLEVEKEEAKAFLRQVLRPKDLAFVLHFDVQVELLQDFTADLRLLDKAIDENCDQWRRGRPHAGTFSHQRHGRGDAPLRRGLSVGARTAQERSGPQGSHPADGRRRPGQQDETGAGARGGAEI